MKMIAGFSVVLAATSLVASNHKPVENYDNVFNGNSTVFADGKFHGSLDFYKTFVNDEAAAAASNFIGLSNANIFYGKKLGNKVNAQLNVHWGEIDVVHVASPEAWGDFIVAEAFLTYRVMPNAQIKVGQFLSSFGSYDVYTADKNLIDQRISFSANNNSAELAYALNPNTYVKVWASHPHDLSLAPAEVRDEFYGAKIGHTFNSKDVKVVTDLSMVNDARQMFEYNGDVNTDIKKSNAYLAQVAVNYGAVEVKARLLRFPKLLTLATDPNETITPEYKGLSFAYNTVLSGHKAQLLAEYDKAKDIDDAAIEYGKYSKRLGLFLTTPVDKNVNLVLGVSERTSDNAALKKQRTTSIGLKASM